MNNMHEKLREFERASGLEIYGLGAKRIPWEHAIEKFAELIVNDICDNMLSLEPMYPANIVALKIRQKYIIGTKE